MPGTVKHVFSNAIADGTNTQIVRPSDWNSAHALTINAVGSEISGAFGNAVGGITFALETDGKITAAAPAGAALINFSAGTTSGDLGAVVFSNSGGVSFGLNGSTITATVKTDYLTTARRSTDAVGLNTAQTSVTWTVNSSGISIDAGAYLTTARRSTDAVGLNTAQTAVTWTVNSSGISLDAGAYLTTARRSTDAVGLNTAQTAVTWTVNSSGISIDAGAYLTTARRSTDAIGLNTAQTNVTWTVNSSGISLNAGGYLTTARGSTDAIGLNTAKTNVTWTANSSGLSFDAGGYAGTGTSLSNISITLNTNGIAASVPATSSLVGTSGISVSTNGSTISILEVPWSGFIQPLDGITIAGSAQANSSVSIFPVYIPRPLAFSHIKILGSFSYASAANTSSASQAYSASIVLYTRNASTLSSVWSGKQQSNSFFQSNSTTQLAGVRGINVTGVATTLPPDQYWAALHFSTANTGTGGNTTALGASVSMVVAVAQATAAMQADNWNGGATNQSRALFLGQGLYSTGATLASVSFGDTVLSQTGNSATLAEVLLNFQNWTMF